jgi:hypothetical protein
MATKLTLSVDPSVVEAAKQYAAVSGTSISRLVENYLIAITLPARPSGTPPILARWRGALANVGIEDYQEYLIGKYEK